MPIDTETNETEYRERYSYKLTFTSISNSALFEFVSTIKVKGLQVQS
jgi:hypothetical protein